MGHRVIQWGTGNVGFHSLRYIIRHPGLELVGVHAHGPEEIGKDAARLCGLPQDTGIVATNDVEALLSLGADAVVYTVKGETRPHEVIPELERILASGANVASTAMCCRSLRSSSQTRSTRSARASSGDTRTRPSTRR